MAAEFEALFSVEGIHEVLASSHNLAIHPRETGSPLNDLDVCQLQICCACLSSLLTMHSYLASTSRRNCGHPFASSYDALNKALILATQSISIRSS